MTPIRIFVGGVRREFAREREQLRDYLRGDPLMRRFFEVSTRLDEVERADIYVGLFGRHYGTEDARGVSRTEREFDRATELDEHRLVFVGSADGGGRHPKMRALIARAEAGLERRRFGTAPELIAGLHSALAQYLEARGHLRFGPFDAAQCWGATLDDLDLEAMHRFIRVARRARQLPLPEDAEPTDLLRHLNLLNSGRLTNAAVLLFGRAPQRFLIASEIKCAHFHGTYIAKPIPSYQIYKGTVFELVDQAVDFVLSKIALSVGTRAESAQAPVEYEIPREVVREAIVNAVVHRDYTDNSSVQVMLFADRLEVMNTGGLPPALTVESLLRAHRSVPRNPLLAEAMYLKRYTERMGTGTVDMIRGCVEAGLPEPEFKVGPGFVARIWRRGRASSETTQDARDTTQEPVDSHRDTTQEGNRTERRTTRERLLAFLRSDPTLTRNGLADRLGITPDGVKYHLAKLRKAGRIRHVGPTKKGRWEVLEPGDGGDG